MAIYHLSVKPVARSAGRSATAAAAYRAAERIECEREGRVHDYSRKQGVEHTEIIVPDGASWASDRSKLWNAAEAAERRVNSTVAREYELALPAELSVRGRVELVRAFGEELRDRYGVAVDIAIHAPHRDGDQRNWHAHVLTTTRKVEAEGLGAKTRILDDQKTGPVQVRELRAAWGELSNRFLEQEGSLERVDHRSLQAIREGHREEAREHQAAGREGEAREAFAAALSADRPAQVHMGPAASAMERRAEREAQEEGRDYGPATRVGAEVFQARRFTETTREYATAMLAYARARYENLSARFETAFEQVKERFREHGLWRAPEKEKGAEPARERPERQELGSFLERQEAAQARGVPLGETERPPIDRADAETALRKEGAAGSFLERREPSAQSEGGRERTPAPREAVPDAGAAPAREDPLLELARSILAQDDRRSVARQESAAVPSPVPGARDAGGADADPHTAAAVAAARDAYETTRAVEAARSAYEAHSAQQAQLEAERLRGLEEARQRAEAQKLAQEEAEREREQSQGHSQSM